MPQSLTLRVSVSHTHFLGLAASQEHTARGLPGSGLSAQWNPCLSSRCFFAVPCLCHIRLSRQQCPGQERWAQGLGWALTLMVYSCWEMLQRCCLTRHGFKTFISGPHGCCWGTGNKVDFSLAQLKKLLECKFFSSMLTSTHLPHHSFPDAWSICWPTVGWGHPPIRGRHVLCVFCWHHLSGHPAFDSGFKILFLTTVTYIGQHCPVKIWCKPHL